jgi:hypothetical protein
VVPPSLVVRIVPEAPTVKQTLVLAQETPFSALVVPETSAAH